MTQWNDVLTAAAASQAGDAGPMLDCWAASSETDHAMRCVMAHYLADTETELAREIEWDQRALAEYASVKDDELQAVGIPSAKGMEPSLHLNLGDGYLRNGEYELARQHLDRGIDASAVLGEDGYGVMIKKGLGGLQERVAAAQAHSRVP